MSALDRATAFIEQQLERQSERRTNDASVFNDHRQSDRRVSPAVGEFAILQNIKLRESHSALLASLKWALKRIDASGLGQGEYFAKAGDAVATAENMRP